MDVQCVEWVADLVRDARGEQRERLDAFALDGFERLLPRLGGIMQNQCHTRTAGGFAIEWSGVEPQESRTRVMHLEFVAHDALTAPVVEARNIFPIEFGQEISDQLPFDAGLKPDELRHGLVE